MRWSELDPRDRALLDAHGGESVIAVRPSLVRSLKGNGNAAILLCQFLYWAARAGEEGWFYNTRDELEAQTGLGYEAQMTARKKLAELGLLEEKLEGIPARLYYRLNLQAVISLIINSISSGEPRHLVVENPDILLSRTPTSIKNNPSNIPTNIPSFSSCETDSGIPEKEDGGKIKTKPQKISHTRPLDEEKPKEEPSSAEKPIQFYEKSSRAAYAPQQPVGPRGEALKTLRAFGLLDKFSAKFRPLSRSERDYYAWIDSVVVSNYQRLGESKFCEAVKTLLDAMDKRPDLERPVQYANKILCSYGVKAEPAPVAATESPAKYVDPYRQPTYEEKQRALVDKLDLDALLGISGGEEHAEHAD